MPQIVIESVSQTIAPAPILLQQTGALVSQGATTLSANTKALLTQNSDLTPLLAAPLALTSLAWSAGVVLATTAAAIPGLDTSDTFLVTIAGVTPAGYNGTYPATVTGANTFTYALPGTTPGTETVPGTYTPPNQAELVSELTSYFSQGATQAVYVLEVGPGDGESGPTALGTWIQTYEPPQFFYHYCVPRSWDAQTNFIALMAQYQAPNAKRYFWFTTTNATKGAYTAAMKCGFGMVEAPGLPTGEFDVASAFENALSINPSPIARATPFDHKYLFGVTPYPKMGNSALLAGLDAANLNYVETGAEGGISTAALANGKTLDGNDFSYWFSADWIQIWGQRDLANEVFNGANNSLNPLWYDPDGINRLQDRMVKRVNTAISLALANGPVVRTQLDGQTFQANFNAGLYAGQCVVNAIPWFTYVTLLPSDYAAGKYNGIGVVYRPKKGFGQIFFNLNVTGLVSP
jgi:hypothetical protein